LGERRGKGGEEERREKAEEGEGRGKGGEGVKVAPPPKL